MRPHFHKRLADSRFIYGTVAEKLVYLHFIHLGCFIWRWNQVSDLGIV